MGPVVRPAAAVVVVVVVAVVVVVRRGVVVGVPSLGASQPGGPTRRPADFMDLVPLADLDPPWLNQPFPEALPGGSLLSQFTRPSFLCWFERDVDKVFGSRVSGLLRESVGRAQKEFAGVIARPLYKCTEMAGGRLCSNVASMSRFMDSARGRPPYRCRECAEKLQHAGGAPGFASASLRALWAYPMVKDPQGQPTPLHVSGPVWILLHAPPDTWRWSRADRVVPLAGASSTLAAGGVVWKGVREELHVYNEADSAALWLTSEPSKAQPVVLS